MFRKKKRTAVRVIFLYLLLTVGSWMFLNSYTNSYNRLSEEKIAPASLNIGEDKAAVGLLEHTIEFSTAGIAPDSKLYCAAYLISPDELRLSAYLISLCNKL